MTEEERHSEFQQLMDASRHTVVRICRAYYRYDSEEFRDLYQEVICTLWEVYQNFRGECQWNTLVYRVAFNVAEDDRLASRRRPILIGDIGSLRETTLLEEDPMVVRLYELIDRLESGDKVLMIMYLEQMRQGDIAEVLGIKESAVNKRIERIKKKLRNMNQ